MLITIFTVCALGWIAVSVVWLLMVESSKDKDAEFTRLLTLLALLILINK